MPLFEQDLSFLATELAPYAETIAGKKIFLTGGTGFFGKWFLESFLAIYDQIPGTSLVVLSRNPKAFLKQFPRFNHQAITWIAGDVLNPNLETGKVDWVFHFATEASAKLNEENPLQMLDVTTQGTRNVLDLAIKGQAERFFLASSGAVYGAQPAGMTNIPESYKGAPDPLHPGAPYAEGKRVSELLCQIYQKQFGLPSIISRCFAFVGPYLPLDTHFAVGNFILDGINKQPIIIKGDGTPWRSYMHAADLTVWLWKQMILGSPLRAYNTGSPEGYPLAEIARMVGEIAQVEVEVKQKPAPEAIASRYVPCTKRAEKELGLNRAYSLEASLQQSFEWYKKILSPGR